MRAKQIQTTEYPTTIIDGFTAFIDEIKEGNVLLMVGRDFEANKEEFYGDFYAHVQRELNKISKTNGLDFSDLSLDNRFLLDNENPNRQRNLHEEIAKIVDRNEYAAGEDVSKSLMSLIETGLFRFVFTTSFDPLVETAMKQFFGKVKVMNFFDKKNRDIATKSDFGIPTIYYLFGKAELPTKETQSFKTFVATDNDALESLHKWQLDMNESALLRYTSDKYILSLGCTQDDWLFRFIWYTLKGGQRNLNRGVIANHAQSDSLSHYLKMNRILIDNDAESIVSRILEALRQPDDRQWRTPRLNCDVFISYSRRDSEYAESLYNSLSSKGLKVWYDKLQLGGNHGGRFMEILKESIDTSTIFIAILSKTITEEAQDVHVYRREWEWAKELKMGLTADCRCYAAFADNYNINENKYTDSLGWLAETDNHEFSANNPNFGNWSEVLRDKIIDLRKNGK